LVIEEAGKNVHENPLQKGKGGGEKTKKLTLEAQGRSKFPVQHALAPKKSLPSLENHVGDQNKEQKQSKDKGTTKALPSAQAPRVSPAGFIPHQNRRTQPKNRE